MSKKDAAVYLKAARLIESREGVYSYGCCFAIAWSELPHVRSFNRATLEDYTTAAQQRFSAIFKPILRETHEYWWIEDEEMDARILALCFAAAMAEAGDL